MSGSQCWYISLYSVLSVYVYSLFNLGLISLSLSLIGPAIAPNRLLGMYSSLQSFQLSLSLSNSIV